MTFFVSTSKREPEGSLSTGSVRRWSRHRPQLVASTPDDTPDPVLNENGNNIAVVLRFFAVLITVVVITTIASWFIMGVTILPTVRVDGTTWLVQRSAWPEGQAPTGSEVLSLPNAVDRSFSARAGLLFSDGSGNSIEVVVGKPYSQVTTDKSGAILVDGKQTGYRPATRVPDGTIGNNYLVLCRSGACGSSGSALLVPAENVLGKVIGSFHPGGFGPIPTFSGSTE